MLLKPVIGVPVEDGVMMPIVRGVPARPSGADRSELTAGVEDMSRATRRLAKEMLEDSSEDEFTDILRSIVRRRKVTVPRRSR